MLGIPINAATLDRRADHRPYLSEPLALWLASHRDRREPQGGAPCRHPRRAHAVRDLCAVGLLCAAGGVFYAARQGSTDSTTGVGWEFQALTAVVLGGVSLAGGKGTVWRAMLGGIIIFVLTNGLVRMGIPGYITSAIIGIILLAAVGIDVKWSKNRGKAIQKIYVNPASCRSSTSPSLSAAATRPSPRTTA